MSNIDLSLDDIIAKTRLNKSSRGQVKKSFKNGAKVSGKKIGGAMKKTSRIGIREGAEFTKTVPNGKWKHDKFFSPSSTLCSSSNALVSAVNENKKVRMNISNLASTVLTADLEELFTPYSIDSAVVHYGKGGEHLGTGEIVMKKKDALKALNDLRGIAIDGQRLLIAIVDGGAVKSIFDRVEIVKKVNGGGGIQKRTSAPCLHKIRAKKVMTGRHPLDRTEEGKQGKINRTKGNKIIQKTLTEEELNAELEAYMKN